MISVKDVQITPTIFPDQSSQIWKLPEDLLKKIYDEYECTIHWDFQNEVEFLHLAQLKTLLDTYSPAINLRMPYLPYGRQDKRVENSSTFALTTFATLLNALNFNEVIVLDAHNNPRAHMINRLRDDAPKIHIMEAIAKTGADCLLFPDEGAAKRYSAYPFATRWVQATKVRDQSTGFISSLSIEGSVKKRHVLIVDDICDGGRTFQMAAEAALNAGAKDVYLYVTHGIFSKGIDPLVKSGISRFFTYKGELVPTGKGCWDYKGAQNEHESATRN